MGVYAKHIRPFLHNSSLFTANCSLFCPSISFGYGLRTLPCPSFKREVNLPQKCPTAHLNVSSKRRISSFDLSGQNHRAAKRRYCGGFWRRIEYTVQGQNSAFWVHFGGYGLLKNVYFPLFLDFFIEKNRNFQKNKRFLDHFAQFPQSFPHTCANARAISLCALFFLQNSAVFPLKILPQRTSPQTMHTAVPFHSAECGCPACRP